MRVSSVLEEQGKIILLQLGIDKAGDGQEFSGKRPHFRGGKGLDLEHIDDIRPVDAHEFLPCQQLVLILFQHPGDLPHRAVGQIKIQVLVVDLHVGQLGEGDAEEHLAPLYCQPVLGPLLPQIELI